jgi:hypothetical protein
MADSGKKLFVPHYDRVYVNTGTCRTPVIYVSTRQSEKIKSHLVIDETTYYVHERKIMKNGSVKLGLSRTKSLLGED